MLREIANVKQIEGEPRRRWFSNEYFDLIIWLDEAGDISGFQLCYNKTGDQHALTWHRASGYMHSRVDDGEDRPGKYKSSPILVNLCHNDGRFLSEAVASHFQKTSWNLEKRIADLVYEKIVTSPDLQRQNG
ncbi:hypothetical protein DENIS_4061 [Desulfonema ishimotonii]|uniref:Uncharacterized protein n=1 Tax=Desulfonema ishimotonii TaxID=45657 RepID=A0A401G1H9_9BACT|nr:hypothetical protein [Desulfonema ishimotonii]GBC63072.1 hypothetical protein DENIS_4061 [Desulfonema ishimotonii]